MSAAAPLDGHDEWTWALALLALLFVVLYGQAAGLFPPVDVIPGRGIDFDRMPVLNVTSFWLFALAMAAGADDELTRLGDRLASLLSFVRQFDRGVEFFVRGDARAIEKLFGTLDRLEPETVDRLWSLVGELGTDDIGRALEALAKLPPSAARRLIGLADQPVLQKLIGIR